jgi:hypothetical protein
MCNIYFVLFKTVDINICKSSIDVYGQTFYFQMNANILYPSETVSLLHMRQKKLQKNRKFTIHVPSRKSKVKSIALFMILNQS